MHSFLPPDQVSIVSVVPFVVLLDFLFILNKFSTFNRQPKRVLSAINAYPAVAHRQRGAQTKVKGT